MHRTIDELEKSNLELKTENDILKSDMDHLKYLRRNDLDRIKKMSRDLNVAMMVKEEITLAPLQAYLKALMSAYHRMIID